MDAALLRKLHIAELAREAFTGPGDAPDTPTDEQLAQWDEAAIWQHYRQEAPAQPAQQPGGPHASAAASAAAAAAQPLQLSPAQLQRLRAAFPEPEAGGAAAAKRAAWFPALHAPRSAAPAPRQPAAVVLAFHSSGNAEDMFTSEGTGSRRAPSALLEACRRHDWLLLAPQLPGRGQRLRDPPLDSLQAVARELLPLVAPAVLAAGGRYAVVAHSMGCWAAYELLLLLREAGLPEPAAACLSAMPWPHMPETARPWRQQRLLGEDDFKVECRAWGINAAVFAPGMWEVYQPMLRADFRLFDEYHSSGTSPAAHGAPPLGVCALHLFWGDRDSRVSRDMLQAWSSYSRGRVQLTRIEGEHLWPAEPGAKREWLAAVAAALSGALAP